MKIVYSPTWGHKGKELEQQMVYVVKEHLKHERQPVRDRQKKWNDCIKLLHEKKNERGLDWLKEWMKLSDPPQKGCSDP